MNSTLVVLRRHVFRTILCSGFIVQIKIRLPTVQIVLHTLYTHSYKQCEVKVRLRVMKHENKHISIYVAKTFLRESLLLSKAAVISSKYITKSEILL